ncbi:MAG: hypothetical protein ACR2PZ_19170 [Pseudomonadales bacterium]
MLDTLQNFAEVGIAVAGFSGIVWAVSERSLSQRERDHLVALLLTSGLVVAFALVPQVLAPLLEGGRQLWLVSSLLYLVVHLIHFGLTASKMLRALASSQRDAIRKRDAYAAGAVASTLLLGQAAAIAFGTASHLQFVYLLILLWHTGIAMAMFGSLLLRALSRRREGNQ